MEQTFANQPASTTSSAIFLSPGPGRQTSPFALSIPAAQQSSLQSATSGLPQSIRAAAAIPSYRPASLSIPSIHQALSGVSGVQFLANSTLSPDPPASGPTSPMTPADPSSLSSVLSSRPIRRRNPRRSAPQFASRSVLESTPGESDPEPAQPRRSTRARKRTPGATEDARDPPAKKRRGNLKSPPPGSAKTDDSEENQLEEEEKTASCCICMEEPKPADLASISGCDHLFCFECIEKWAERENTCPLCKVRFAKIDRVNKARRKGGPKNTKRVKQKDQRSDIAPGAALEGLLASFASSANFPPHRVARLIFSGMGGNPFMLPGSSVLRSARAATASAAERANALEDSLFSSDTDDDDDSSFLPASNHSFHDFFRAGGPFAARGPGIVVGSGIHGLRQVSLPFDPPTARAPAGRSYASNVNDSTAGRQATNPLEIDDDSEDDDDEEIEILQVTRPL